MKLFLLVFVLTGSLIAFGQGHGGGHAGGPPGGGVGMGSEMGHGSDHGMSSGSGMEHSGAQGMSMQQPLKQSQINGGAFRMLEAKTGMTAQQLQTLYSSSGAKNFGQFVSAIVVSKNLGLDTQKVLSGLKTESLGRTLQSLGVGKDSAKQAIKKADQEVKDAEKAS